MPVTSLQLETRIFAALRATLGAAAAAVRFGTDTATVIPALRSQTARADTPNVGGVDDANSGTVYVKVSTAPAIPENRRLYILSGGTYVPRRIVRVTDRAGAVLAIEYESAQRGQA